MICESGRAGGIRTRGLFVPNEALYQAEPQPVTQSRNYLGKRSRSQNDESVPPLSQQPIGITCYPMISKMASTSTAAPVGNCANPRALRA